MGDSGSVNHHVLIGPLLMGNMLMGNMLMGEGWTGVYRARPRRRMIQPDDPGQMIPA